ncbi:MAG: TRAP transporter small permease [Planctomycetes bacterium]|nr:TRAP transporter small permease [Planctomycetota bacterium]
MNQYDKFLRFITDTVAGGIAAVLVGLMFVIINVEIVCRYIFNTSTLFADEYCGYFFAIAVYAGLSAGLRQEKLIKIDLPGRWSVFVKKPFVRMLISLAAVILNSILLYSVWLTFSTSLLFKSRSIQASRTLLAYPQGAVVLAIGILCLVSLWMFLQSAWRCLHTDKGSQA